MKTKSIIKTLFIAVLMLNSLFVKAQPPFKLTPGTLVPSPVDGAVEYDGDHIYITTHGIRTQLDKQYAGAAGLKGSVIFSNGANFTQNTGNLFWDNDLLKLGIGTNSPNANIDVENNVPIPATPGYYEFARFGGTYSSSDPNGGRSYLISGLYRSGSATDWKSVTTRLVSVVDFTQMGYIDFNPPGIQAGMAIGVANVSPAIKISQEGFLTLGSSATPTMYINGLTQIGIGTNELSSENKLTVLTTQDHEGIMIKHASTNTWAKFTGGSLSGGSYNPITQAGDAGIIYGNDAIGTNNGFIIAPYSATEGGLRLDKTGNVGIGMITNYAAGYKLFVEQGILTEKVKVALNNSSNWSDYVFDKNYALPNLTEVEKYISNNKHLPDIPSAAEVVKEGIDLGQMDAKLLAKIEELTLYMIEINKTNTELKNKIETLEAKLMESKK